MHGNILLFFSFEFQGTITAYGAANEHALNSLKAGPGTTFIVVGRDAALKVIISLFFYSAN